MSRSNWNDIDAIVLGLLILIAASAFALPVFWQHYQPSATVQFERNLNVDGVTNIPIADGPGTLYPSPRDTKNGDDPPVCNDACQRDRRDLGAQESMAAAAWAMFWVAFASLLIGFGTLFLVWRTVEHTKAAAGHAKDAAKAASDTNEITKSAFLTDQRPWVNVDVKIVSDVTFDTEGMSFQATITLTNVGKSPATSVFAVTTIDVEEPDRFKDLKTKMMTFWAGQQNIRLADPNSWGLHVGDVVFPGEVRKRTHKLTMSRGALNRFEGSPLIMPGIIVACTYGPKPEGSYFSTVRLFHLNGPGAREKVNPMPLLKEGAIAAEQVSTSSVFSAAHAT